MLLCRYKYNNSCRYRQKQNGYLEKKHLQLQVLFCVDYYDKLSNLLEDLRKVERFAQSVGPVRYSDGYSDIYSDIKK